jgi:methoxymalonate biosynthesis acyl carrier protein
MTTPVGLEDQVYPFIRRFAPGLALSPDIDIFEIGFMNSLLAMRFVIFIETTFGVSIPDEELDIDNIRTPAAVAALVRRLSAAREP